jgi:hypothetical protein
MNQTSISYSKMLNYNLKLIPEVGNAMPYNEFMDILFGNNINDIPRLELLHKNFVVDINHGTFYFVLSKFEEYLHFAKKRINWKKESLCPINYFDCLEKLGIEFQIEEDDMRLMKLLAKFKSFLSEKDDFYSNMILKFYWDEVFKGVISSYNENPFMVTLKFRKEKGFPLVLNIVDGESSIENAINIDSEDNLEEFQKVFNNWKNNLMMDNPDEFVINCLTNVTGSIDMANFIFKSHQEKSEFVIKVDDLNEIINFKSAIKKNEYIGRFKSMYQQMNLFEEKEGTIFLNFEGFNKYLLNLEIQFLNNFEDKERINILYYNVMDELVNSYKKLYTFFKII